MRAVIQRVKKAKVFVKNDVVGEIGKGLFVLLGIETKDGTEDAEKLAEKLIKLRIMADKEGKMNLSVKDVGASILVVSQFTLYADISGGNRPSFVKAKEPETANALYLHFIKLLKGSGIDVKTGKFGEYMNIFPELDGPVTIVMESRELR